MRIFNTADLSEETRLDPDTQSWVYNGLDSCITHEATTAMLAFLDETTQATYDFSRAKQGPVLEMQLRGILVDEVARQQALQTYRRQTTRISRALQAIVTDGLGLPPLNWKSPKQLMDIFYGTLGLSPIKKFTPNGYRPTINAEALERLQTNYYAEPLSLHILALRDLDKKIQLLSTAIDPDGRFRTSFNIAGTDTGRMSSSISAFGTGGNLQNIDRTLRAIFIADPGKILVNVDLKSGDSLNLGAICWNIFVDSHGEDFAGKYLNACESADIHTEVARLVWPEMDWGDDPKKWKDIAENAKIYRTFSRRDLSKRAGHGSNYRGKPPHMAKVLRLPLSTLELFQYRYFSAFPCIPDWHKWVQNQLNTLGFLKTLHGRRRFFYGRLNDDRTLNQALAYAPQGSTAEAIDWGMLRVWRKYPEVQFLCQVHDSLLFQIDRPLLEDRLPLILADLKVELILQRDRPFHVPLDAKTGWNWGEVEHDEHGNEVGNLWGMKKWKGLEPREAPERHNRLSFQALLTG